MKRFLTSPLTLALLYAAFIFGLSSVPSPPILGPLDLNDKLKHFALYFVFAVMVARAVAVHRSGWVTVALWTITLASLYGASDEFHQRFVPGRSCDITDWMADTIGALAASLTLPIWLRRKCD